MEFGIMSFADMEPAKQSGSEISAHQRMKDLMGKYSWQINKSTKVTWKGKYRAPINNLDVNNHFYVGEVKKPWHYKITPRLF